MSAPVDMTEFAVGGHPDDVRTFLGLLIVINGIANQIEGWVGSPSDLGDPEKLVALARAWDGFDGSAEIPVLREAMMILNQRAQPLR